MREVKCSTLVEDFDIYPREAICSQSVSMMCEAKAAGIEFPPIVYDTKSHRIVDGFHRRRMHVRLYGDDALIPAIGKKYKNIKDMLLDAFRYNGAHGRQLTSQDRARSLQLAMDAKIAIKDAASALSITVEKAKELTLSKTAKANGNTVTLKRPIAHKAGKQLTKEQAAVIPRLSGNSQMYTVNELIRLIENDLFDWDNEETVKRLLHLGNLIRSHK